jgi:two-component system response regulator
MRREAKNTWDVLVADDSESDRFLFRHAARRAARLRIVGEVGDGATVIAYLKGTGRYANRELHPFPDLLLLDLKMPVMNGFEVLEWLSKRPTYDLTVVVFTHSMEPDHIVRVLDLGADLFQVKPRSLREYDIMIRALEERLVRTAPFAHLPHFAAAHI